MGVGTLALSRPCSASKKVVSSASETPKPSLILERRRNCTELRGRVRLGLVGVRVGVGVLGLASGGFITVRVEVRITG